MLTCSTFSIYSLYATFASVIIVLVSHYVATKAFLSLKKSYESSASERRYAVEASLVERGYRKVVVAWVSDSETGDVYPKFEWRHVSDVPPEVLWPQTESGPVVMPKTPAPVMPKP